MIHFGNYESSKKSGVLNSIISNMSNDFPIVYGVLSIILAVTLAILAAFVRKLFSDYQDKKKKPA